MSELRMTRRGFLRSLAAAGGVLAAPSWLRAAERGKGKPSIVLIMADDMGFSDIGCYGGEIHTPNLDRLAAGGLRFSQFYNTSRCCPTRASLLTGLYSHQAGVGHMTANYGVPGYQGFLSDRCVTIAEAIRRGGYRTLMAGKWHVGEAPEMLPTRRGFDRFYGMPSGGGVYFWPSKFLKRPVYLNDKEHPPPDGWYSTDGFTDYAIRFVDEARRDAVPFFLYLAYISPHWPLQAWPKDIAKYRRKYAEGPEAVRARRYERLVEMGLIDRKWALSPRDAPDWQSLPAEQRDRMDLKMAVYAAQIECMDRNIGRLIDKLRELGILDDTLVMFLSDNGGCAEGGVFGFDRGSKGQVGTGDSFSSYGQAWANAGNTPFRRYKHWVHEGGIATPLIAHWPAVLRKGGAITDQVGHCIDLLPTCLDVAGVEYPRNLGGREVTPVEGRSLLPIFHGRQRAGHESLFWEHEGNRAVRKGQWKLVAKHGGAWELYDLSADRTELHDVAGERPEKVRELAALYEAWARRCGVLPWPVKRAAAKATKKSGGGKKAAR
ncbi:MAG TPA: arylsulfatase [Phycisphaerae bacterium]|nr:arylsulfatase [Phycisphaerae bacterium]